tara:strand:+ start:797 stop:1318 length:522 start_codon:yes stop_codon:yes gene_type:complete
MSRPFHGLIIVFNYEEGIALGSQGLKRIEEFLVVTGMEADRGFIKNVEDSPKVRAQLGGKANTLSLTPRKSSSRSIKLEITQTDLFEETQALGYFRNNIASDSTSSACKVKLLHSRGRLRDWEHRKIMNRTILDLDRTGDFVQSTSLTVWANNEFFLVRPIQFPIKVNLSFRC